MADTILVCSGGGHLKQLFELAARIGIPAEQQLWMTFDNALSRSLLKGRRVEYVPFAAPRDLPNAVRIRHAAVRLLRQHDVERAISTGSSPAVAVLPVAARAGAEAHYIESAARADGPSLSGRIVARNRRIATYTQYPAWTGSRWQYRGSIFDRFAPGERSEPRQLRRAVVSVGTQKGYPFDRLYRALVPLLAGCEVLWQTGDQDVSGFGITGRATVPHDELSDAIAAADVVVAHSGTGAALTALEVGKTPVLVPRLARFGEHVDDHQLQIAAELARRELAIASSPDELSLATLIEAASGSVNEVTPPPFLLDAGHSDRPGSEGKGTA
jgi:UDP-N-acetylglucosamine--N-acetylmuramyl-(pentapeptide) pyrophosphoryl-undecaprenol N-acetylglucosamine transferase